jgi:hypothetical protein
MTACTGRADPVTVRDERRGIAIVVSDRVHHDIDPGADRPLEGGRGPGLPVRPPSSRVGSAAQALATTSSVAFAA